jgi:toxin ParE1/3/4
MTRVRFTPQAKTDLFAINRFIALDNPDAARRLIAAIRQQCQTLAKFPDMGRLWEELKPPLRSFPVGNYLDLLPSWQRRRNRGNCSRERLPGDRSAICKTKRKLNKLPRSLPN